MGLQRPLDWAETTARLSRNDRTIEPQRPVNAKATTARLSRNDQSMQKQRPHDAANPPEGLGNTGEKPYLCRK